MIAKFLITEFPITRVLFKKFLIDKVPRVTKFLMLQRSFLRKKIFSCNYFFSCKMRAESIHVRRGTFGLGISGLYILG